MPSFADDIVLAILALLLFGPKKLPVLARELGKWVAEFRRASNEFKYQMEEELRQSEQADRQKQIAAMEAAAPVAPALASESSATESETPLVPSVRDAARNNEAESGGEIPEHSIRNVEAEASSSPLPIATAGSLNMMPPDTGLPVSRGGSSALGPVIESIPESTPDTRKEAAHAD
ncbi:sec-independent protein translocase protein TatB [Bryocella elongata]|uniref:Sec-independent protein translocase protein TatB n=1 Tax=Bryocella elongata TaxID=863522 RepID=A0A1H5ZFL6_9BACT|nr:twin-arginine translocase TatA/TatE family subunit [Bryocella elongata]SEG34186.1 sec-independent protein translocase protein TatB [Bryocella elongata]